MRWGIRYQLILPLMGLMVGMILVSWVLSQMTIQRAREQIAIRVDQVAQTLSQAQYPLTYAVLEQVKQLSDMEFLLIGPSEPLTTFTRPRLEEILQLLELDKGREITENRTRMNRIGITIQLTDQAYLYRKLRLDEVHPNPGNTLFIFFPETVLQASIRSRLYPVFFGLLFGLIAILFTWGIGRYLVNRLQAIAEKTKKIASGDFSSMVIGKQKDELTDLMTSINEMAEQLRLWQDQMKNIERNRLLSQLSAGLAHQLRNSVTGAKLALQLHESDCPGDKESLRVILRQLVLMEADLRRFMDIERYERSPWVVCDIGAIIDEVILLIQPRCQHNHIQFHYARLPEKITRLGNRAQLGDLFLNLLMNAVEASPLNGTISLSIAKILRNSPNDSIVPIADEKANPFLKIEVCDEGNGPDANLGEKIFEPFVSTKSEGIGLGLTVVQQIVISHGGEISWRRETNHTIFTVILPLNENEQQ